MVNWSEPQKQSTVGMVVFAAKTFREMVAVVIISIGSLTRKKQPALIWFLVFGSILLYISIKAFLEYFFFTFYVSENQLIIKKGIFSKKTLVIPFERIQTVQLHQSLLHRIIHHYRVAIDTAGSEKTEVSIHALSYAKAISLKEVLTQETISPATVPGADPNVIRLSPKDLFKMAVSANHLETFGLIIAFVLARFQDVKDLLGINAYDWVESQGKTVAFSAELAGIIIFFTLAFSILISVLRIILRFSDLSIVLGEKGFQLKHGLLSSQQQFIGAKKIQFIQWNANWIRRKIGMYVFHVKTAGEEELKKKQRIHMPVTSEQNLLRLAAYYQPAAPSSVSPAAHIQPQYVFRKVLFSGLPFALVATGIAFFWWEWQALWLLLWTGYSFIIHGIYRRNYQVWVNEEAVEISRGVWGRQRVIVNWQKLQLVTIRQGIYQRRRSLADLVMHTASGDITIPYLRHEEAKLLADYASMKVESSQQQWM
jgi:putative membrane protein